MNRARLGRAGAGAAVAAASLVAGIWIGARGGAASAPLPGSSADPLVTRSYVVRAVDGVLAEAGGRMRRLAPGAGLTLGAGTLVAVVGGSATLAPSAGGGAGSAGGATGGQAAAPSAWAVDLTGGRALASALAGGAVAVPVDHLVLVPSPGATLVAGSGGATVWLSGAEATAVAPSGAPSGGG